LRLIDPADDGPAAWLTALATDIARHPANYPAGATRPCPACGVDAPLRTSWDASRLAAFSTCEHCGERTHLGQSPWMVVPVPHGHGADSLSPEDPGEPPARQGSPQGSPHAAHSSRQAWSCSIFHMHC
jgi:hypothetical protein